MKDKIMNIAIVLFCIISITILMFYWSFRDMRLIRNSFEVKAVITEVNKTPKGRPLFNYTYTINNKKHGGAGFGYNNVCLIGDTITVVVSNDDESWSEPAFLIYKADKRESFRNEFKDAFN